MSNVRTPLHDAASAGLVNEAKRLLAEGADPNARDIAESTPLHLVVLAQNDDHALSVAKVLIEAGADPRAKNGNGHTPAQMGHANDVQIYLQREARKRPQPGLKVATSPARASLKSDVERRIDDACRTIPRATATHDAVGRRDETLLVYRTGPLDFARLDRTAEAFDVREGEGWRAIAFAELPADLVALVAESIRVAKAPRVIVRTFVKLHPILKGAYEKATHDEKPEERAHLGAQMPVCPGPAAARLAVWMAELALEGARSKDAKEARALLAMAASSLDGPTVGRYRELLLASRDRPGDSDALGVTRRAVGAAATLSKRGYDVVWVHAKGAAGRLVPILRANGASVTDFLRELDRRILVAEMLAAAVRHAKVPESFDIARVLWRGPELFLGRLADERFALVGKLGKSWSALTGTRDEMLASVPDFAFEHATRAF